MTAPKPTAADLERAILGDTPTFRGSEVAAAAGVSLDGARRLWRALGFPDAANQSAFTAADRDALALVAEAVAETGIEFETMLRLTRSAEVAIEQQRIPSACSSLSLLNTYIVGQVLLGQITPSDAALLYARIRAVESALGCRR